MLLFAAGYHACGTLHFMFFVSFFVVELIQFVLFRCGTIKNVYKY